MIALASLLLAARAASDDDVCRAETGCKGEHYWSSRARSPWAAGSTPHTAPTNFSSGPAWVWENEDDEMTRHSPLIDAERSIYITGTRRIRKFSPDGALLWKYLLHEGQRTSTSPALHEGHLYLMSRDDARRCVFLSAFDLQTGRRIWMKIYEHTFSNWDPSSLFIYNGTIILPTRDHPMFPSYPLPGGGVGPGMLDGNNQMLAVSLDGAVLWKHVFDDVIWNFMLTTTGDGDILVSSICGGVWRVGFDGKLVWRGGRQHPGHWCGYGGGMAGPNGIFYSVFNDHDHAGGPGVVQAVKISDGSLLWETYFGHLGGWQSPAVGKVGPGGRLAVVAALGGITNQVRLSLLPVFWAPIWVQRVLFFPLYLRLSWFRAFLGIPRAPNAIVALDPLTGEEFWRYEEREWDHVAAKSDEERFFQRASPDDGQIDGDTECLPSTQGIPLIAGDGTVYGSSGHFGDLTAIKDTNGNGIIEPAEVSRFETGVEFSNSPSLAPGMLVAAPCWGPVYVFKDRS